MIMDNVGIRNRQEWCKDTALFGLAIVVSCLYFVLNIPNSSIHVLMTVMDNQIPRIPAFTIPYLAFLPWLWGVIFYSWLKNRSFRHLAYSVIIVNLVAFCVYLMFQTYMPRDLITSNDFFSSLLQFIYNHDQPYNAFPSLHSALSVVVATYFVCRKSRWSWVFILSAVVIIASTLLIKQHSIADAVSGIILGSFVTWLVFHCVKVGTRPTIDSI
jgi:membrane-associated phospholipid phosphatase